MRLDGRIALVTGASRGIGAAVALRFAQEGAHLILSARTSGALEEIDDKIQNLTGKPATLVPIDLTDFNEIDKLGAAIFNRFKKLDILMMLRVQKERIPKGSKNMMTSFKRDFCLRSKHLLNMPYLMHPGPVNRNIEISDEVLDNYPKSLILRQVEMGVYLRMACLKYILK